MLCKTREILMQKHCKLPIMEGLVEIIQLLTEKIQNNEQVLMSQMQHLGGKVLISQMQGQVFISFAIHYFNNA